jgi:hypothetical protein
MVMFTPAEGTSLPRESRSCTVTGGAIGVPAAVFDGCWTKARALGTFATMAKASLTSAVRLPLEALNVLEPVSSMLRSSKVAIPEAVVRVSVPLRVPVPELRATLTDVPEVVTLFPNASCRETVTGGTITAPADVFDGCCRNFTRAAAAGLIRTALEVSFVSDPLVKRTVIVSATL